MLRFHEFWGEDTDALASDNQKYSSKLRFIISIFVVNVNYENKNKTNSL